MSFLKNKRDYEEGMCGRVYTVCHPCSDRYDKSVAEEMEEEETRNPIIDWLDYKD